MNGIVTAVSCSGGHTFSKPNVAAIRLIVGLGVEGDAHLGVKVQHRSDVRKNPDQPNLRQVHLFHEELQQELRAAGACDQDPEPDGDRSARGSGGAQRAQLRKRQHQKIALVVDRRRAVLREGGEQRCKTLRKNQEGEQQAEGGKSQQARERHPDDAVLAFLGAELD